MRQNEHHPTRYTHGQPTLGRRGVLAGASTALAGIMSPFARGHAAPVAPQGKLTLAWHTNIAARWLDPQQHDGYCQPRQLPDGAARWPDQEFP